MKEDKISHRRERDMNRDRFTHVCLEAEGGRDAFVTHPSSAEEGIVKECILSSGHLVVETPGKETRCWDFRECEEMRHTKIGPMI